MKMIEKYMLFILIVLTVITNSKYTVASSITTNVFNIEDTITYWTPERMRDAKPFSITIGSKNKNNIGDGKKDGFSMKASNTTDDNPNSPYPLGKLFFHNPGDNKDYFCTASVLNTDDGNIGLTAAHCLYTYRDIRFANMTFCPEYDKSQCIPVKGSALYTKNGNFYYDYGMIKFGGDGKLKDKIGSFNWDANPGNNDAVTIFGYPIDGDLQCAKDGNTLCMWQGNMYRDGSFRHVPVDTGHGSSGGPWIRQYDPNAKSGWVVASTSAVGDNDADSAIYAYNEFVNLIQMASNL